MTEGPDVPAGLAPAGRALWVEITSVYRLDPHELPAFADACGVRDVIEGLAEVIQREGYTTGRGAGRWLSGRSRGWT
jgi:hypothetical protein